MLDVLSFIEARGGNPEAIRESQRRRHAPVEAVDEVIAMFEAARVGKLFRWGRRAGRARGGVFLFEWSY